MPAPRGLAIGVSPAGIAALGAEVLGIAAGAERGRDDLELLGEIGGECLEDLKRRTAQLFLPSRAASWAIADGASGGGEVHRLEIVAASRTIVLVIQLGAELFARFVTSKLPPSPAPGPLGAAGEALARLPVRVSAALGPCRLTVAELSGLDAGDVLVLDRALDAPIPLAIGGSIASRGTCAVVEAGAAGLALRITQAPAG